MTTDATYRYRGIPDWLPGQDADPAPDADPGLTAADIARLAGVGDSTAWRWVRKDGFPAPLHRPWARERKWDEEKVTAWLRSRNLVSGRARGG